MSKKPGKPKTPNAQAHKQHSNSEPPPNARSDNYYSPKNVDPELLLGQLVRNILNDPLNIHILAEYLSSRSDDPIIASKALQGIPKTPRVQIRDISNHEIIRPRDLPACTGLSRTQIWRLEKAGLFVEKIYLSAGAVGFRRIDVENWLVNRQAKGGEKL